ncbi:MerR family transcriptional regulator [Viridibacterium curvum]|uniref:HTH-type transcriptional repressor CarH n=1 Tax=Viridibacterium curvum TaxID=1101404 RepID=A0ABP9QW47_9RHOO
MSASPENPSPNTPAGMSIAAVERDTGLGKDTLRVWERRYGFPNPLRDPHGERLYPLDQVERLHRIKRLMDLGWRPGKIFATPDAEWDGWLQAQPGVAPASPVAELQGSLAAIIDLVRLHSNEALRSALQQCLLRQGLNRFVIDTIAPLNMAVGEAWMRGTIEIADEHLYTEHVQNLLRAAISQRGETRQPPRILLTTLPEEVHGLGLLMAEALMVAEGAQCVSLGTRTPLTDVEKAMQSGNFDILALSFSASFPQRHAVSALQTLSAGLPAGCEIWAGGGGVAQRVLDIARVKILGPIQDIPVAVHHWRSQHAN